MMLQIKPVNQTTYKVFADKEYLLQVEMSGKVTMFEYKSSNEGEYWSEKQYNYIHTFASLDNALRSIYERECKY